MEQYRNLCVHTEIYVYCTCIIIDADNWIESVDWQQKWPTYIYSSHGHRAITNVPEVLAQEHMEESMVTDTPTTLLEDPIELNQDQKQSSDDKY